MWDLGVIFDEFISFDDYISSVCRSTHFHLKKTVVELNICYLIMQLLSLSMLSFRLVLITVTQCYTTFQKNLISRFQSIQYEAARILTRMARRDHITEVLNDLHWLKIEKRIVYKMKILTFNAFINRTAPLFLCELIEQQNNSANTRLADDSFQLKVPPPSRKCADTF